MNKLNVLSLLLVCLLPGLACRSSKPPPPTPQASGIAARLTSQAETQSTQQNWPAAATEWKKAADQFGLLNDLPRQAIALHNQGQAEQEQSHLEAALRLFEIAAALNQKTGQTSEWWRNQIALLQVEAGLSNRAPALERRFQELAPKARDLHDPSIHGLFQNELGLSNIAKKQWAEAEASFLAAEKAFAESKNATGTAAAQGNRALLAEATHKFATAESLWRSSLSQFEKLAQPTGIARSLAGIGRSLLGQQKNLAEAEDLLRRAAENFRLLKLDAERKKALEAISLVPRREGRNKQSANP